MEKLLEMRREGDTCADLPAAGQSLGLSFQHWVLQPDFVLVNYVQQT